MASRLGAQTMVGVRFAGAHGNVANTQRREPGVAEYLRSTFPLLARMRNVDMIFHILDRNVFQPNPFDPLNGLFNWQFAQRVRRNSHLQSVPRIGIFGQRGCGNSKRPRKCRNDGSNRACLDHLPS
jgi:hypothetical protein